MASKKKGRPSLYNDVPSVSATTQVPSFLYDQLCKLATDRQVSVSKVIRDLLMVGGLDIYDILSTEFKSALADAERARESANRGLGWIASFRKYQDAYNNGAINPDDEVMFSPDGKLEIHRKTSTQETVH